MTSHGATYKETYVTNAKSLGTDVYVFNINNDCDVLINIHDKLLVF